MSPALVYGAEYRGLRGKEEAQIHVAEMKMLRWPLGVTRKDKIRNEEIHSRMRTADVRLKMRESRLRWWGHVHRREEDHLTRRVLSVEIPGRRCRGRPRRTIAGLVGWEMEATGLTIQDAKDRKKWKSRSHTADPE